jgi:hypothetical protein
MDKLKSFIQQNRELFDSEPLPEGHEMRFMKKMEKRNSRKHNYLIYISVAALLLLVVTIGVRFLKEDSVSSLFYVDPCGGESHTCYYDQMQKLSQQIEYNTRELPDYKRQEILMNMESIMPRSADEFSEMLPEDISSKESKRLNKEYYQQLYEGMIELASLTN